MHPWAELRAEPERQQLRRHVVTGRAPALVEDRLDRIGDLLHRNRGIEIAEVLSEHGERELPHPFLVTLRQAELAADRPERQHARQLRDEVGLTAISES